jgi:hypothetical protein
MVVARGVYLRYRHSRPGFVWAINFMVLTDRSAPALGSRAGPAPAAPPTHRSAFSIGLSPAQAIIAVECSSCKKIIR